MYKKFKVGICMFLVLGLFVFIPTGALAEKITLRVWTTYYDGFMDPMNMDAKEYMAENPNINVKIEGYTDYWTKMPVSLSAGTEGDIIHWMARDLSPWLLGGFFLPLPDNVMTAEELEEEFFPLALNMWKWRGKYLGIPNDLNVEGFAQLMVNQTLLHEHGHKLPTEWIQNGEPGSWEELLAFAKEITVRQFGRIATPGLVGWHDHWDAEKFTTLLTQITGGLESWADSENKKMNFNTPEGKKALNFMYDMLRNQDIDNFDLGKGIDQFVTNRNAFMAIAAPHWGPKTLMEQPDMEWTMLRFPPIFGKLRFQVTGGWGNAVSERSEHAEEAWKYVKFAATYERQKRFHISSGAVPVRKAALDDPDIMEKEPVSKYFGTLLKMIDDGIPVPVFTIDHGEMCDIVDEEIADFYIGKKGVEQALADAEERVNEMIKKEWAKY